MKQPIGDPTTAEAALVLSDGIARKLKFDFHALYQLEEVTGRPFMEVTSAKLSVTNVRALLYVGLHRDAIARGETWTLDAVDSLVNPKDLARVIETILWALAAAFGQFEGEAKGETPASVS